MIKCFKARISGRVQGVSFRIHAQRKAISLGLTGWVRNRDDGDVEVCAEGEASCIEAFIRFLHTGPPAADVAEVDIEWLDSKGGYPGFNVRY